MTVAARATTPHVSLAELMDTLPHGVRECDIDGRITYANLALGRMYGCSAEDMVGREALQYAASPEEAAVRRARRAEVLRLQPEPQPYRVRDRTTDGRLIEVVVDWNYRRDTDGNVVGLTSILTDVTDQARVEKALQDSLQISQSIVETARAIILVLDAEGRIVSFNPFMAQLSGCSLNEVKGQDWFETFVPSQERDDVRSVFARSIEGVPTRGNITRIKTRTGQLRDVEWYDSPLTDGDGGVTGLLAIGLDVTERLHLESERASYQSMLETKVRERTAALEAAVEHAHRLLDMTPVPVIAWIATDDDWKLTDCNVAAMKVMGEDLATLQGSLASDLYARHPRILDDMRVCGSTQEPVHRELLCALGGSEERWWSVTCLFAAPNTVLVATDDIHALKMGYLFEERERQHLASILDNMVAFVSIISLSGRLRFVNRGPLESAGLDIEDVRGNYVWETPWWSHSDAEQARLRTALSRASSGEVVRFDARVRVSGHAMATMDVLFGPIRSSSGEIIEVVCHGVDITERVRAESELAERERQLALAQRIARLGFWEWDIRADTLTWSDQVYEIFGITPDHAMTYDRFMDFVVPADRHKVQSAVEDALSGRSNYQIVHAIDRADGKRRYLMEQARITFDAEQRPRSMLGTVLDVTDVHEVRQQMRELEHEIARVARLNLFGEIAAFLGHELQQPLTAIANTCTAIQLRAAIEQDWIGQPLQAIEAQSLRAGDIVRSLRKIAKPSERNDTDCNMVELLDETLELLSPVMRNESIRVEFRRRPGDASVRGDRTQLQQVFFNVLQNSREALHEVPPGDRMIVVDVVADAYTVSVCIEDSGVGFGGTSGDKLFESFFSTKSEGMGLGLAICRRIVEHHHGRIWAERRDDRTVINLEFRRGASG